MREWHVEHMRKTVVKYVNGLSTGATNWEKRNHRKYCNLTVVCKQIGYDMKHGVTKEEVMGTISRIHSHPSFKSLRTNDGAMTRLSEIEGFLTPRPAMAQWY
jgi:hypothetical protein